MQQKVQSSLKYLSQKDILNYVGLREGEFKIGQKVKTLDTSLSLQDNLKQNKNCKYALLGIPEDFGPRANMGRAGCTGAWNAFLSKFLNVQSNQFLDGQEIIVLGEIICDDLQKQSENLDTSNKDQLKQIRDLVQQLDERVYPTVQTIVENGLIPIVIGGGHNNSYGMLRGSSQALKSKINSINIDPHADFRGQEGRHSGNGFSYASIEGYLDYYYVLGLHESYNNQEILDKVNERFTYTTFDDILRDSITFEQALQKGIDTVKGKQVGIEVDLDCIEYMPTSAFTPSGVSSSQIRQYINQTAKQLNVAYLHIAEGAPDLHQDGKNIIGKMTAYMVSDFIKMRNHQTNQIQKNKQN